jgi:hypothetical protein
VHRDRDRLLQLLILNEATSRFRPSRALLAMKDLPKSWSTSLA